MLLTGSDLGDRCRNLETARDRIESLIGNIVCYSSIHETEPWGFESNTRFLNQALVVNSNLGPEQVLESILSIEKGMGRKRNKAQWTSRSIDIDIICAEDLTFNTSELTIPHRHLHQRQFVLKPLCEVAPNWTHPIIKKTYRDLLSELNVALATEMT